jgi:hypothetical protein
MDPTKKSFSSSVLKETAIIAADVDNNPTKSPFPSSIIAVQLSTLNYQLPHLADDLPRVKCRSIIDEGGITGFWNSGVRRL